MAAPNIVNTTTITGRTAVANSTTTATAFLSNDAASNQVFKINSIIVSNIDGIADAVISIDLFRSSVSYYLARLITVPADSTLVVLSKDMGIYLEEGDSLRSLASANGDLQVVCSYEVIS